MKKKILSVLAFISLANAFAQKVDLDKMYFDVKYQMLPKEAVPLEKRTYSIKTKVTGDLDVDVKNSSISDQIILHGWKKTEENPTVAAKLFIDEFSLKSVTPKNEMREDKDKDGRVIRRIYTYWVVGSYSGYGSFGFTGPNATVPEVKKEEKKTNSFLNKVAELNGTDDYSNESIKLPQTIERTTSKFDDPTKAANAFELNRESFYKEALREYKNSCINRVNYTLNEKYGFKPFVGKDFLWILDSKKHPEYTVQQEAIAAVVELFKTYDIETQPQELEKKLQPLIAYFNELKTKYPADEKADKKMRYSAYYNLAKIYYLLDKPAEAIKESEGLIKNEYDKSDGENLIEASEKLSKELKQANVPNRHNLALR